MSFPFFLRDVMLIIKQCFRFSVILLKFCSKMPYSAGIMLAPKIAYSAQNYASRIHPSLFCFPNTLSVPQGEAEGSRGSKTVLLPVGPIIKCFVIPPNSRKLFACKKIIFLRWAGTQICSSFKVHNLITCKLKVQVVVSLDFC